MRSVLGTILDPAADKTLMTTLVVTLAMKGLLPGARAWPRAPAYALTVHARQSRLRRSSSDATSR
jgi:phosphatidylglycerophosphate synthase